MTHALLQASNNNLIYVYDHDSTNKLPKVGERTIHNNDVFIAFNALIDELNQSDEWIINTEGMASGDGRGMVIMGHYMLSASRCFWMDGYIESFSVGLRLDLISLNPFAVTIVFSNNAEHDIDCTIEINDNRLRNRSPAAMITLVNKAVDKITGRIPLAHPIQAFNPKTYKHDLVLLEDIVKGDFDGEVSLVRVVGFRLNSDYSSPIFIVGFTHKGFTKRIDIPYDEYLAQLNFKQTAIKDFQNNQ